MAESAREIRLKADPAFRRRVDGSRILSRLIVVPAFVIACPSLTFAQIGNVRDQAPPAPPPTGTGRITGQVVAADTGTPVKHAQIMLSGMATVPRPPSGVSGGTAGGFTTGISVQSSQSGGVTTGVPRGMVQKQAETDEGGRFDFTEVPAGTFSVMVGMPPTGFVRPTQPESVRLTEGQSASVTIKLTRGGAITGRVLDETGEPIAGVTVHVMRRDSTTGGRLMPTGGSSVPTDDLGHYRIYGLAAGDYYVEATYNRSMTISFGPGSAPPPPHLGYGPTYYPGSSTLEGARRVTVRAGEDTPGVEFALQRVMLARITGVATDSSGRPLATGGGGPSGSVSLSSRDLPFSGRGGMVRPDGTFQIEDVAPGEYELVANVTRGTGPDAEREAASVPVSVNGSDVTVNIQTNTGATVSGRVVIEGNDTSTPMMPANVLPPRITVSARPDPSQPGYGGSFARPADVADDGTFELKGVRGAVMFMASGSRGILKSVSHNGQDVTTRPMLLRGTERVTDVQIVLTTDTGRLNGLVTDSAGQPAPSVPIVIFPDDPERWFSGSPFVLRTMTLATSAAQLAAQQMTATPGQALANRWTPVVGGFSMPRLLPGRYWVAVLPDTNAMPSDREGFEKLRASATGVTVTTGEAATVQLTVKK